MTSPTKSYQVAQIMLYMWSCDQYFGNSRVSMREVITTSIYKDLTRLSWLKINNLGLVLAMALKYYIGMEKELKLKVTK